MRRSPQATPAILIDREEEACVRGCYRCLLSYFNQPDHELIDRASDEAKQLLDRSRAGRGRSDCGARSVPAMPMNGGAPSRMPGSLRLMAPA